MSLLRELYGTGGTCLSTICGVCTVDTFPEELVPVWGVGITETFMSDLGAYGNQTPAPEPDMLPCEDFSQLHQLA